MADIFPGRHSLQSFLTKNAVAHDTHGGNWLLSLESDMKTVEDILETLPETHAVKGKEVETQYFVYSAQRYTQTIVFVVLKLDCTFAQLQTLFGEALGLLGKVVKQTSFLKLTNFLLGAKGTKIEEWGTVFSETQTKFSQRLLNLFAVELKIDSTSTLVLLYHELSMLHDMELCHRLNVSVTEKDASRLFKEHFSNSRAFRNHSQQLKYAKTAVEVKKCLVDYFNYMMT